MQARGGRAAFARRGVDRFEAPRGARGAATICDAELRAYNLNAIMVDATGMCGACMVPVLECGKLVRKHACIDGPELDSHIIDWDKFLPRFLQFKEQEKASMVKHGLG